MSASCFQYEKACVLFNVAAIYSQLGSYQNVSNPSESYKVASHFFQKAAGVLLFIRDNLAVRFKYTPLKHSDLSEFTLTALIDLMLGQAAECYWQRANIGKGVSSQIRLLFNAQIVDKSSSAVTSQVAAQASDYYLSAYKHSKDHSNTLTFKSRFPKEWPAQIKSKSWLLLALAHLHMPASVPDRMIPERLSRLDLAKSIALKSEKLAKDCSKDLQIFIKVHYRKAIRIDDLIFFVLGALEPT